LNDIEFDIDSSRGQLSALGWKHDLEAAYSPHARQGLLPARVLARHRDRWVLALPVEDGVPREAILPGAARARDGLAPSELPTVGDWVLVDAKMVSTSPDSGPLVIRERLPRYSSILRRGAGDPVEAQVLAANVDTVAVVMGLDENYNLRRMERYLSLAWESGASPIVILSKADLASEEAGRAQKMRLAVASAPGVPVFCVCALSGLGMDELSRALGPGSTTVFLGSSGAGKSTLLNALAGEDLQRTGDTREVDGKGRHTTTSRELFTLPSGAMVIDSPGMRELGLWGTDEGVESEFPEIEALAALCRFSDCAHGEEPGCAVREAAADGRLDPGRLESYLKQKKELAFVRSQAELGAARAEKKKWKVISKFQRTL
jgi:ribosome biogenesis GTPase